MQSHDSSSEDNLKDKVILITGASGGIGKATAIECAKQGATVIIHGKSTPKLELLYDEIIEAGYPEAIIYPLDFEKMSPQDCETLNDVISKEFGRLDGLFNNVGWQGASSPIQLQDIKLWHQVMQINLNACFMLTQACIPLLNQEKHSAIVFTIDDKQSAYWGAYGVAKAGQAAFMQILADELESTQINVTGINPGPVHTNFRTRAYPGEDPSTLTKPEAIAKPVALLLSESGTHINGETSHGKTFQLDAF